MHDAAAQRHIDRRGPFVMLDGGAVIVDGMLYVNSGYNGIVGRVGNVLLAFDVR